MEQVQHVNLQTRQQIINRWNQQSEEIKNSYCCPNCRSVLEKNEDDEKNVYYFCSNVSCEYKDAKFAPFDK